MEDCNDEEKIVYEAVCKLLQEIDCSLIHPLDPMGAGILDLTFFGDSYLEGLGGDVITILTSCHFIKDITFPRQVDNLINEFMKSYEHLENGKKICQYDMDPINFPKEFMDREIKEDVLIVWSILIGL